MPITDKIKQRNDESNKMLIESINIAFFKLLNEKEFDNISISEICQKAGVSRTGFYRNFSSKTQIIDDFTINFFNEIQNDIRTYITVKERNPHAFFIKYFETVYKNIDIIRTLKKAGFQSYHLNKSNEILLSIPEIQTEEQKAKIILFNGALHNITLYWLFNENRCSIEQAALWCEKYLVI